MATVTETTQDSNIYKSGYKSIANKLGINENYLLPDKIVSTEYLNFHDQKFSKSKGIGMTILEAIEKYNTDVNIKDLHPHLLRHFYSSIAYYKARL